MLQIRERIHHLGQGGVNRPAFVGSKLLKGLALVLLPLAVGLICLCIGRYPVAPGQVLKILFAHFTSGEGGDSLANSMIWNMRLPRILLALAIGAGLSGAGVAFQSLFRNPLATPDTLGVASGASFGAALALLLGWNMAGVQGLALVCGLGAAALTFFLSRGKSRSMAGVVLAGVALSSLFSALVSLVKYVADVDSQLPAITYWLMGSLSGVSWRRLWFGLPLLAAGGLVLHLLRWRLNLLTLAEDEARACGCRLGLLRGATAICASAITASAVSLCGQVGWVGLLAPHICRMAVGSDNARLMPAALSGGAIFLVIVDTAARSLTASELPISILTAVIGAPCLLALLAKTGGWKL